MAFGQQTKRYRSPGLDGDAPEDELADRFDGVAHVVGFACRDTAGRHHKVVVFACPRKGRAEHEGIIFQNAEVGHARAELFEHRCQQWPVGIVNGIGGKVAAAIDDLVAGREYGDLDARADFDTRHPSAAASATSCGFRMRPCGNAIEPGQDLRLRSGDWRRSSVLVGARRSRRLHGSLPA